jgi:hypothetical protein
MREAEAGGPDSFGKCQLRILTIRRLAERKSCKSGDWSFVTQPLTPAESPIWNSERKTTCRRKSSIDGAEALCGLSRSR